MNKTAWCISMESAASYPQSACGKNVKSEHPEDLYGSKVEDYPIEPPDDDIDGLAMLDLYAQAGVWRRRIDTSLSKPLSESLRLIYSDSRDRREEAALAVANHIEAKTGVSVFVAFDECCHEAGMLNLDAHNNQARELLLDVIRDALKKADRVIGG